MICHCDFYIPCSLSGQLCTWRQTNSKSDCHLFVISSFFTTNLVASHQNQCNQHLWPENKLLHKIHSFQFPPSRNLMTWFHYLDYILIWFKSNDSSLISSMGGNYCETTVRRMFLASQYSWTIDKDWKMWENVRKFNVLRKYNSVSRN